jgi:hypothetical protein
MGMGMGLRTRARYWIDNGGMERVCESWVLVRLRGISSIETMKMIGVMGCWDGTVWMWQGMAIPSWAI